MLELVYNHQLALLTVYFLLFNDIVFFSQFLTCFWPAMDYLTNRPTFGGFDIECYYHIFVLIAVYSLVKVNFDHRNFFGLDFFFFSS
jgi:hypothetical protein